MVGADRLHEIRLRAWERNRGRAGELAAVVERSRAAGAMAKADRTRARALTHQLIGSTGTFGHDSVGQVLGRVQQLLADGPDEPAELGDDRRLAELGELVDRACQLLGAAPSTDDA